MNPLKLWVRRLRESLSCTQRRQPFRLDMLPLEDRAVPAGLDVRSIDGTGNNLTNTLWGSDGQQFIRVAAAQYADGISTVGGTDRPSAREISNVVADQTTTETSDRFLSAMVYAWGQFIDHDMDLTLTGSDPLKIPVPTGDPSFDPNGTGTKTIDTTRSVFDATTGTSTSDPRQQTNAITAFLDGSMVYGSDAATATKLRTLSGGHMKMSADGLLPLNNTANFPTGTVAQAGIGIVPDDQLFAAGDVRANENPELTSLQTLFVREHNRIADQIAAKNPKLTDEQIYQQSRAIVIGEIESVTYNEWLPALLGPDAIPKYTGYKSDVNPGISNEFATAAFRFGHSLLGDDIEFLDNNGNEVRDAVELKDAFFNSTLVSENGIDPILKYLATDPSSELDSQVVDGVRNFLFGPPGSGGLDLASLNIQRGRDHGLADYNTTREAFGLPKVTSFSQITSDTELQGKLQQLYGSVDNIDLWVGVLAEDHVAGGSMGATGRAILIDQFTRLRDGDRFWYQNSMSPQQRDEIGRTTLADIVKRNTDLTVLQPNLFVFTGGTVAGTVFTDTNKNGTQETGEAAVPNTLVFADLNRNGKPDKNEPSAITDSMGAYTFLVPVSGTTAIVLASPQGQRSNNPNPHFVNISAGGDTQTVDFGINVATPPQPGPMKPLPAPGSKAPPPPASGPQLPPPRLMAPSPASTPTKAPPASTPPKAPPAGPGVNMAPPVTGGTHEAAPPQTPPAPPKPQAPPTSGTTPPPPAVGTQPPKPTQLVGPPAAPVGLLPPPPKPGK